MQKNECRHIKFQTLSERKKAFVVGERKQKKWEEIYVFVAYYLCMTPWLQGPLIIWMLRHRIY